MSTGSSLIYDYFHATVFKLSVHFTGRSIRLSSGLGVAEAVCLNRPVSIAHLSGLQCTRPPGAVPWRSLHQQHCSYGMPSAGKGLTTIYLQTTPKNLEVITMRPEVVSSSIPSYRLGGLQYLSPTRCLVNQMEASPSNMLLPVSETQRGSSYVSWSGAKGNSPRARSCMLVDRYSSSLVGRKRQTCRDVAHMC